MNQDRRTTLKLMGAGAVAGMVPLSTAQAETPKRGGNITVATAGGSKTSSFDPRLTNGVMDVHLFLTYNRLIQEEGHTGDLKPELATSWESRDKNKTWIINLRKGVKFHDGSTFDADDVVYSLNLHAEKGTKSTAKAYMADVKDIKKLNQYQVQVRFNNPNPDLPAVLTLYQFLMVKNGHTDWLKGNGTGGYIVTKFDPGVLTKAERFKDYWRQDSDAYADTFKVLYIGDPATAMNALLTGQVDIISGIPANMVARLKSSPKHRVVISPGKGHFSWPMMRSKPPYNDTNVRQALKHAVDRKKIVELGMAGYGIVASDNPISPAYAEYVPIDPPAYDPEKAKHFLKKAGMSSLDIELSVSNGAISSDNEKWGLIFQESAKQAGININVIREPSDGYWDNVWMKKPFTSSYWNGRPTATMMFDTAYISASSWNESEYKVEEFDKLILSAKASESAEDRKQKLGEAQRMITEDGSVLIPTFRSMLEASTKRIGGHKQTKAQDMNNGYLGQLYVI